MSYFRDNIDKLEGYEPGFQPKQLDVVKLNTNENPFEPSPKVMEKLRNITTEQLRRYPDPIANQFREAAGELNGVSADHIMCCNGGDDLLNLAFRAFCDDNRPAAYPVPTYSLYPVLAKIQNCPVIEIPFDKEFNLPSKLTTTNAPLTIVCNPNAPSGSFINIEEIASLADEISGVLLVDEAYSDYAEKNCASLVKDFDNVIILRSLSKGYSLAGLRFGYAIAQPELIEGLMKVKDSYNVDAISIALATEAIKDQEYFKSNIEKIKMERTRLTNELRNLGLKVPNSFSNFVFAEYKNAATIFEELKKRNIFVRYFPYPGLENKLRISVGTPEQDDKLIRALKEILGI